MVHQLPDLMTEAETAELLRARPQTLTNWRHLGVGPPWVKMVGRVRYRREAVDQWLREQETASSDGAPAA